MMVGCVACNELLHIVILGWVGYNLEQGGPKWLFYMVQVGIWGIGVITRQEVRVVAAAWKVRIAGLEATFQNVAEHNLKAKIKLPSLEGGLGVSIGSHLKISKSIRWH